MCQMILCRHVGEGRAKRRAEGFRASGKNGAPIRELPSIWVTPNIRPPISFFRKLTYIFVALGANSTLAKRGGHSLPHVEPIDARG